MALAALMSFADRAGGATTTVTTGTSCGPAAVRSRIGERSEYLKHQFSPGGLGVYLLRRFNSRLCDRPPA